MTNSINVSTVDIIKHQILNNAFSSGFSVNKLRFKSVINWLLDPLNESQILNSLKKGNFDYPDYWNLPQKLSHKLSSDEVDLIQSYEDDFRNYFANNNAFGLQKPHLEASKLKTISLSSSEYSTSSALNFMFKHFWKTSDIF